MPIYVTLYTFTDQGVRNIKESPQRLDAAVKAAEAKGITLLGVYYTIGEYDLVVVAEAKDEETGLAHTLATVSMGNVRSKTLRAYTPAQFEDIVKKM